MCTTIFAISLTCIILQILSIECASFLTTTSNPISQSLVEKIYPNNVRTPHSKTCIFMASLKPAAIPLLDSGKALARGGELLIDATNTMGIYAGGFSQAGAGIRNAGDSIAQAAASCRFKTGYELVLDEMREGATCLDEASVSFERSLNENEIEKGGFGDLLESSISYTKKSSISLESAGAGLLQRLPVTEIGERLSETGKDLVNLSTAIKSMSDLYADDSSDTESSSTLKLCSEKIFNAGEKMKIAGNNLSGVQTEKPKGKSWLKGGL